MSRLTDFKENIENKDSKENAENRGNAGNSESKECPPRVTAILLAAGRGTRMGSGIRKQFMELAGRPVLSWSLNVLALSPIVTEIVLVIPAGGGANKSAEEEQEHIRRLFIDPLPEAAAAKVRALVPGGAERYNSVYNGLEAIQWPCDYVFIHDGARPLITEEMLEKLFRAVQEYKAVVAASPSKDTVKITDDSGFVQSTPDRSRVWNIQTPQCFAYELVKSSYEKIIGAASDTAPAAAFADFAGAGHQNSQTPRKITDDAMVVEYASDTKVRPVDTGYQNIKITTPEDLLVAEVFLRNRTER
ncbi:MAG: 2-C-methyl-D-erythritol 4-phosphate cytidylyltransferase [Lachnospiraceae bacterium]|jgi:2-C-methyl-D-erythritol 4-phosphate cytidylyltransferase|nr:2-C-methyl-D-erythritol 4-phosphate cytidylyltransferase [Lachnospiraceae bacterium]MCH4028407.1 2-C-methyl-D-erythritol 4-phosphate cytidylyltransferase [Lachnospiraceae bacterium]MCH4066255.1 2-C-methyl-D-erythritol 4-phosphate cytidylyltransferase [Lachnospiraceae bacterium]MCH4112287.1 2-C-methyl-D-erythritol 4-phosphate cytidylyltransferase [Lachnospiraceae bacterium]MCI1391460.1 2-C-methyl-D-erythritol 4-phosphate cytidylyltransferase [Lachnospiraceae bacterium]